MIDPLHRPRPRGVSRSLLPSALVVAGAAALVGVAALTSPSARAGDIQGMLRAPDGYVPTPGADERKPYYWEEWNGFLDPRPASTP